MPAHSTQDSQAEKSGLQLLTSDALLIVDVQNDFLPGGALAVPHADRVLPALNRYIAEFSRRGLAVVATRDWHPANHCSFVAQGGRWPSHCVAGTAGAEFSAGLTLPPETHVASKAMLPEREQYSAFDQSDLAERLRQSGVQRLYIGGLATDYCVLANVRDALQLGFAVIVLTDAIAAVDDADGQEALREMRRLGAELK